MWSLWETTKGKKAMRKSIGIVTCVVFKPIPSLFGGSEKPWHAGFLEMHLMGIERSMFRDDLLSTRYNLAVVCEAMYRRNGLVLDFSLN